VVRQLLPPDQALQLLQLRLPALLDVLLQVGPELRCTVRVGSAAAAQCGLQVLVLLLLPLLLGLAVLPAALLPGVQQPCELAGPAVAPQAAQGLQTAQAPPLLAHLAACAGRGVLPQPQPLQLLPPAGMQLGSTAARGSAG
jgi:hypothetical protein